MGMLQLVKKEGREEGVLIGKKSGRKEGRKESREELLIKALKLGNLSVEEVANLFDMDLAYVQQRKAELS